MGKTSITSAYKEGLCPGSLHCWHHFDLLRGLLFHHPSRTETTHSKTQRRPRSIRDNDPDKLTKVLLQSNKRVQARACIELEGPENSSPPDAGRRLRRKRS